MSGLNDAWLADDSLEAKDQIPVKVFKERTPGEVPEISDHATLIAVPEEDIAEGFSEDGVVEKTGEIASVAIEEYQVAMRDMQLFTESITSAGGMCLSIAQESLSVLPGFVNEDRPLGFFTKHPSKTQLSAALEAIEENRKSTFDRMVEKVKNFFKEVGERIVKFFDRISGKEQKNKISELEKLLQTASEKLTYQEQTIKQSDKMISSMGIEIKKLGDRLIEESDKSQKEINELRRQNKEAGERLTEEAAKRQKAQNELRRAEDRADAVENAPKYLNAYATAFENSLKESMGNLIIEFKKHIDELPASRKKQYAYASSEFIITSEVDIESIVKTADKIYKDIREYLTGLDIETGDSEKSYISDSSVRINGLKNSLEKLEGYKEMDFEELTKVTHLNQFIIGMQQSIKSALKESSQKRAWTDHLEKMTRELKKTLQLLEDQVEEVDARNDENAQKTLNGLISAINVIQTAALPAIGMYNRALNFSTWSGIAVAFVTEDINNFITRYNSNALSRAHSVAADYVPASVARAVKSDQKLQTIFNSYARESKRTTELLSKNN